MADLTLDKHMLCEACEKKSDADAPSGAGGVVSGGVPGELRPGLSAGEVQPLGLVQPEHGGISPRSGSGFVISPTRGRGSGTTGFGCCCGGKAGP